MQTPEEFSEQLTKALGDNLKTVALYGSAAVGDRTRKYSDINVLVIVDRVDVAVLSSVATIVKRWMKDGNRAPLFTVQSQLHRSQDVFPIELGDIHDRHRILFGDASLLTSIAVQPAHLRRQLEFELRSKLFMLRQAFVETTGGGGSLEELMARALSSVTALFRGVLRLTGDRAPSSTPEVLRALESRVAMDAEAWQTVWRLRQGEKLPRGVNAEQIFDRLLAGLQQVVNFVDAHPAS